MGDIKQDDLKWWADGTIRLNWVRGHVDREEFEQLARDFDYLHFNQRVYGPDHTYARMIPDPEYDMRSSMKFRTDDGPGAFPITLMETRPDR